MIENKNVRVVVEDAVIGKKPKSVTMEFGSGYSGFQFPFTVSFCDVIHAKLCRCLPRFIFTM